MRPGPSAHDVAVRALVLHSVAKIAMAISMRRQMSDEEFVTIRDHYLRLVLPFVPAFGIEDGVFLIEDDPERLDASWPVALVRIEHFQVMAWALGHLDALPAYDQLADIQLLDIPALKEPAHLPFAVLRPANEIEHEGKIAELWYWRAQVHPAVLAGESIPPSAEANKRGQITYADEVRRRAETGAVTGILPPAINGDFPAFGKSYRDLTEQEYRQVSTVAYHRHYSFTWLRGLAPMNDWDHTARNL